MSAPRVAIVGSGMVGANMAWSLVQAGFDVTVFEKGPDYPYPQRPAFERNFFYDAPDPRWSLPPDLLRMVNTGSYAHVLWKELVMRVGGSGTAWTGLATRMTPVDYRVKTERGFGLDWPITYDDLEPWMCAAEARIGVSGTDDDNPWAPWRSKPYPLPPFELTPDDIWLAGKLAAGGIHLHSTPQARTSRDWDGRPACMNVGQCAVCPIGARYNPAYHLLLAVATGRCRLVKDTSVRRVLTDANGRARGVLVRENHGTRDVEHGADLVIVAAHSFESARLLLLSKDSKHPNGLGNSSGHVGRHLTFHHIWNGHMHWRQRVNAGTTGFWTGQSDQFVDPPRRGEVGGVKVELPSLPFLSHQHDAGDASSLDEAMAKFETTAHCRQVSIHAETVPTDRKYLQLGERVDRHGDPVAHVHYDSSDFDKRTHEFGREIFERIGKSTDAMDWVYPDLDDFGTWAHHMGTVRMARTVADGPVDSFGAVFDTPGLHVIGLANFVGSGGAVNPTLTGVALALRAADRMIEQARS